MTKYNQLSLCIKKVICIGGNAQGCQLWSGGEFYHSLGECFANFVLTFHELIIDEMYVRS